MTTTRQPQHLPARPRSRWLLPEDGITDEIAIELAATGARPVALTPASGGPLPPVSSPPGAPPT